MCVNGFFAFVTRKKSRIKRNVQSLKAMMQKKKCSDRQRV